MATRPGHNPFDRPLTRRSLLVGAAGLAATGLLAGCSDRAASSSPASPTGDSLASGQWIPTTAEPRGATVLVVDVDPARAPQVSELVARLNHEQYSVLVTRPGPSAADIELGVKAVERRAGLGAALSLVVFGCGNGDPVWTSLVAAQQLLTCAVLVSNRLPVHDPDFSRIRDVSVRGIYAEQGASYSDSYQRAHLGMARADVPHDFLVYGGGVKDYFFSPESPDYHAPTCRAALDGMVEWLNVRGTLGRPHHGDT